MEFKEFTQKFNIELTQQQLAGVRSVDKPTLLLAVPGSGKTTVLITRVGYMIYCLGIKPEKILVITYTRAATMDMKSRFAEKFGDEYSSRINFRTINSLCDAINRYYCNHWGKTKDELISEPDKKRLLRELLVKHANISFPTEAEINDVETGISYIKNMMIKPEEFRQSGEDSALPMSEIFDDYQRALKQRRLMDFDDQMVYARQLLLGVPALMKKVMDTYEYICVDEAQDTSRIQHEIIKMLAARSNNLFMVGDEDQSIYGFRAAYPEALLNFEKDHPGAQVLLMEENFRSGKAIVSAADEFIQKNEFRHRKSMMTNSQAEGNVFEKKLEFRGNQYAYMAKILEECETPTAVLYRFNECAMPLIDLLDRKGIEFNLRADQKTFFSNRVVIDIKKILNFIINPEDVESFADIFYKLGLRIKRETVSEVCAAADRSGRDVMELLEIAVSNNYVRERIKEIGAEIRTARKKNTSVMISMILNNMDYAEYLKENDISDNKVRILRYIAKNEPDVKGFLRRLDELEELTTQAKTPVNCPVTLSSIHSAKGLEYDSVYIIDAIDGIFPEKFITRRKFASNEELNAFEEERRLYYVAATRAKRRLTIFTFENEKTSFSDEFFGRTVEPETMRSTLSSTGGAIESSRHRGKGSASEMLRKPSKLQESRKKDIKAGRKELMSNFRKRGYVVHKLFGEGKIISIEGDNIVIEFEERTSRFKLSFLLENGLIK